MRLNRYHPLAGAEPDRPRSEIYLHHHRNPGAKLLGSLMISFLLCLLPRGGALRPEPSSLTKAPEVSAKLVLLNSKLIPGEPIVVLVKTNSTYVRRVELFFVAHDGPWAAVSYANSLGVSISPNGRRPVLPEAVDGRYMGAGLTGAHDYRYVLPAPSSPLEGDCSVRISVRVPYRLDEQEWPPSSNFNATGLFKISIDPVAGRNLKAICGEVVNGSYYRWFGPAEVRDFLLQVPLASSRDAWVSYLGSRVPIPRTVFGDARAMLLSGDPSYRDFVPEIAKMFALKNPNLSAALSKLYESNGTYDVEYSSQLDPPKPVTGP